MPRCGCHATLAVLRAAQHPGALPSPEDLAAYDMGPFQQGAGTGWLTQAEQFDSAVRHSGAAGGNPR